MIRNLLSQRSVAALILLLAVSVIAVYENHSQLSGWLEDATGETNLFQQMKGLVRRVQQRPLHTEDMVPVAYTGVYPYGANTFFEQEVEEQKLRRSMEMLRDAGVKWVRQQFPWNRIEPEAKGRFSGPDGSTWQPYDRIVALAYEYGLELVVRLDIPPSWAKKDHLDFRSPPSDLADYGDYVAAVVQRYKGRVRYYQIWNEPNLFFEWGDTPDAAEYVRLLRLAYTRAKAVDPQAVILSAPLSPTLGTPDGLNESDLIYLQMMYDAGAKDFFDILSAQGYGLWTGPGDRRADPSQVNFSRVQLLREIMAQNSDAQKAIWISEMGWDAVPQDFQGIALHGRVTEEQQARYTAAAYRRIQEEWPWVGVVFYWFFRKVAEEDRSQEDFYFRLVDPDFTPMPVYQALQRVAKEQPVVYTGWHQADHWGLIYDGAWQKREDENGLLKSGTISYVAQKAGSTLSFVFKGSTLALAVAKSPQGGHLKVEIDESPLPANRIARSASGEAVVDLHDSEQQAAQVMIATGLANTEHKVTFTALGDGEVVIDGIVVTSRQTTTQQDVLAVGLIAGVLVALTLAFRSMRATDRS